MKRQHLILSTSLILVLVFIAMIQIYDNKYIIRYQNPPLRVFTNLFRSKSEIRPQQFHDSFSVFSNICIEPHNWRSKDYNSTTVNEIKVQSPGGVLDLPLYTYHIQCSNSTPSHRTNSKDVFDISLTGHDPKTSWVIQHECAPMSGINNDTQVRSEKTGRYNGTLYLPSDYSHGSSIAHFLLSVFPGLYTMKVWSRKVMEKNTSGAEVALEKDTSRAEVVLIPPYYYAHQANINYEFLHKLEITSILQYKDITEPVCFEKAVIRNSRSYFNPEETMINYLKRKYGINSDFCKNPSILFIQRTGTNRQILNIDELLKKALEMGFSHSKVVTLDNHTFHDQIQLAHCANIIVGVQGQGLIWTLFLPPGGVLVEIGFEGWDNRWYSAKLSQTRPDVKTYNINCKRLVDVESIKIYAKRYFNYTGVITEDWERKIIDHGAKISDLGPVKNSHCICDSKIFEPIFAQHKHLLGD